MNPIKTRESNFTYLGPTREIADLPCRIEGRDTFSVWELNAQEREWIANGANIRMGIYGVRPIPPVSLGVVGTEGAFEAAFAPCRICGKEAIDAVHQYENGPDVHAYKIG